MVPAYQRYISFGSQLPIKPRPLLPTCLPVYLLTYLPTYLRIPSFLSHLPTYLTHTNFYGKKRRIAFIYYHSPRLSFFLPSSPSLPCSQPLQCHCILYLLSPSLPCPFKFNGLATLPYLTLSSPWSRYWYSIPAICLSVFNVDYSGAGRQMRT